MNTQKPKRLFFDLETAASEEALELMADPKPPANLKDPAKIADAIEQKKRELIETAALDPDYGRILSIGYASSDDGPIHVSMVGGDVFEDDLLCEFWQYFAACSGNCAGYNILGFDLPYLMRRSMALGVRVSLIPVLAKFRTEPVTDLMAILYNWGSDRYKSLKQVARLYRIPNDCPDMDGSKVKDMTPGELREYQASDVRLVQALYQKMNGVYFNHR